MISYYCCRSASTLRRHTMTHKQDNENLANQSKSSTTKKTKKGSNKTAKVPQLDTIKLEVKLERLTDADLLEHSSKRNKTVKSRPVGKISSGQPMRIKSFGKNKSKRIYKCSVCNSYFRSNHYLQKHKNDQHGIGGYDCKFCNKKFYYAGVLRTHLRIHTREKPYQCVECPKSFADSSAFRRHKKVHEKGTIRRAYSYYQEQISKGIDFNTDEEALRIADEKSTSLGELIRLFASGTIFEELKYCCKLCKENFSNKYDYAKHMESHTGERPFKCVICNKGFLTKSHLRGHEFIHTGKTPFECSFCGKKFNARNSMKRHEALHSGAKICKCKHCDESFSTTYQLYKHIDIVHQSKRPYQCAVCNKGFLVRSHLTEHMRTHTKEKPYICTYCNKTFSAANSLKRHEKIHTNDRPHKCTDCEKSFITIGDLKKHMRTHSDERPFQCDVEGCTKAYKFISDLNAHKERHSNTSPIENGEYKCQKCDLAFQSVKARKIHMHVSYNLLYDQ